MDKADPSMRVFCILNGGLEVASARERLLRYVPDLAARGIDVFTHVAGDVRAGAAGRARYWSLLLRSVLRSDAIFIHRVPLSVSERALLRATGRPAIFDVDDAVWYAADFRPGGSPRPAPRRNDLMATLRLCRRIRAGNAELARHLEPLGIPTGVAPTCAPRVPPRSEARGGPITVGWIGHSINLPHLDVCAEALRCLVRERPEVRVRVVADRPPRLDGTPVEFAAWTLNEEPHLVGSFDIGIMPLADNAYTRGKCGYKLLLYMAHGIPVVASPVGVNAEIVRHGENGFLARTPEEWLGCLRELVEHPERRALMGGAGKAYIQWRYDHEAGARDLVRDLEEIVRRTARPERRRVTLLLFHHPPMAGSASYRNARLARHLEERGWKPHVVAPFPWPSYARDPTIAFVKDVCRMRAPDPALAGAPLAKLGFPRLARALVRWIAFPDRAWVWAAAALPAALQGARASAAIFSTSPPESAHVLAWAVRKITRRPWVADHSNEWTDNPARDDPPALLALHRRLERLVIGAADRITTLSPHHTRLLQATYPRPERVRTLWTGWDPAEARPPSPKARKDKAVILFTGMFYGVQRPDPFLDAAERAGVREVELHVLGEAWDSTERLRSSRIPVRFLGRLPRSRALEEMRRADFLLITLTEQAPGVVPGKMFEYAAAGRPILAVVPPEGEVARWIRHTRTGCVVPCTPPDEAAAALAKILVEWKAGKLPFKPDAGALSAYSAGKVAEELDRVLLEAIASRYASR